MQLKRAEAGGGGTQGWTVGRPSRARVLQTVARRMCGLGGRLLLAMVAPVLIAAGRRSKWGVALSRSVVVQGEGWRSAAVGCAEAT